MQPGMGMGMGMQPGMGMGMGMGMQPGMAPGMYPNVAQGMQMAFANPYAGLQYRNANWAGYRMGVYSIPDQLIEAQAPMIFMMYDRNQSGTLEMFEVPAAICYVFQRFGLGQPNMQDIQYCMYTFDQNGDGRLSLPEFMNMLRFLAGRRFR